MNIDTYLYRNSVFENNGNESIVNKKNCQLVIGFGEKQLLSNPSVYDQIREKFPLADIAMCSTAGEIFGDEVLDGSLSIIAFEFDKTRIQSSRVRIDSFSSSFEAGSALVNSIEQKDLKYIFILSDGSNVNGSELVRGIESVIQHKIPVTGGLAGDGVNFRSTLVGLNETPQQGNIIAIGFYGDAIQISHGSMGGWEMFGLEKKITKAVSNELFEIDHVRALDLYKQYLGKYADDLPGSALLFPLSIKLPGATEPIVRTILSINPETSSMVFAGDVPEGSKVRFMKANFDRLIDAASDAAQNSLLQFGAKHPKLAILVSCVGRKIILGKRIDEEVEAVREVFNKDTILSGFYSYGEISPFNSNTQCELHNQTMTITTFDEL
jgi:hypothetical protein